MSSKNDVFSLILSKIINDTNVPRYIVFESQESNSLDKLAKVVTMDRWSPSSYSLVAYVLPGLIFQSQTEVSSLILDSNFFSAFLTAENLFICLIQMAP